MSKKLENGITVPDSQEWRSEDLTRNFVADYKPFVMVDGPGVR